MVKPLNFARLAAFPIGLGLTSVLVGGTLNRVMIVELGLPVALVGFLFAVPLLVSPLRVWLGYRSDAFPLLGLRRVPYIIGGWWLAELGVVVALWLLLRHSAAGWLPVLGMVAAFAVYGLGKNLGSNSFEALQADLFPTEQRPKAVTTLRVAMFVGIIGGAIALGRLLEPFAIDKLWAIGLGVAALACALALLAALGQEKRGAVPDTAVAQARAEPFAATFRRYVWEDTQVRRFFVVVLLAVVGTLAQDVLLEPYGALVLGMSVSQTTRLTALWGVGTVLAMMAAGIWLIKKMGYGRVLQIGLLWCIVIFVALILAGALGAVGLFQGLIFLLGAGTGLASAGMLVGAIEFTNQVHAGFLMGVWGVAVQLGQALGSLLGGSIVGIMLRLSGGNALLAYCTVFAVESFLLAASFVLFQHVDLHASQIFAKTTSAETLTVTLAVD